MTTWYEDSIKYMSFTNTNSILLKESA